MDWPQDLPEELQRRRSRGRVLAMQALYQLDRNADFERHVNGFVLDQPERDGQVQSWARAWASDAWEERDRLDRLLRDASPNWPPMRMNAVDRAVLRLATFELIASDVTAATIINEAVNLAKFFSTAEAGPFVNGILDAIRRRPDLEDWRQRRELPEELIDDAADVDWSANAAAATEEGVDSSNAPHG